MSTSTETSLQCQDQEEDSKCERKKGTYQFSRAYKALLQQQMVFLHIDQHTAQVRVWYKVKSVHKPHPTLSIN